MNVHEKLDGFKAKVMAEAGEKNVKMLSVMDAELASGEADAERSERGKADERVRLAAQRAAQTRGHAVAAAALESKKRLIARRNELTDELFGRVRERLAEFTRSPEYDDYLAGEIKALAGRYPSLSVRLRPEDMRRAEAVRASGAEVLQADGDFLGGFIAYTGGRGVFDRSFDARLEQEREDFNLLSIGDVNP